MEYPTLLITSAIKPNNKVNYIKMSDSKFRLERTLRAIEKWRENIPNIKIVIVDGTNFNLKPYIYKDIECLFYENDLFKNPSRGKGSGESQDIVYALKNSKTIENNPNIMKITAKYWINNIHLLKKSDLFCKFKCKPIISNFFSLQYISTVFMCFHKEFYLQNFENLQDLVDDSIHHNDIEHIMAKQIIKKKINNYIFGGIPLVEGWCGTSDKKIRLYKDTYKHFLRKIKYNLLSKIF